GLLRDLQLLDEGSEAVLRDTLAAGQLLELLVGLRDVVSAHDRLDRLRKHLPGLIQILAQPVRVGPDPAKCPTEVVVSQHAVSDSDANTAENCAVSEIPLKATDGQFGGQMLKDGVAKTQIALRILEEDWVDLVRHGAGADLTS